MIRPLRVLLSVSTLLVLCAAAVRWASPTEGEDLLIQREYAAAAASLEAALAEAELGEQDRILFLLGEARLLAGDAGGAVRAFRRLASEQGGSDLVAAGRFLAARALEQDGDLRAAASIYREQIERLIGLERKEEVAATYLGLAEKAQRRQPPDHQRVVTFCDLALDLGLEPATAAAARLKAAAATLALGDARGAVRRLEPLVDELSAERGRLRAMLLLGRARHQAGQPAAARAVLRDLRAEQPDAPEAGDAAYQIALTYGVPTPPPAALDRAVSALEVLAAEHPTHDKAKEARFLIAQCYRHAGRGEEALAALRAFLDEQGDQGLETEPAARAMVGDVLAAQGRLQAAIEAWRDYLSQHPAHADWERVQRAIVDAEWLLAIEDYEAGGERFDAARERLQEFGRDHPLDERNPMALYLLGDMLRQEERFDEARAAFARCVSKYPGRDESARAQFAIGEIFETETFDYDRALDAYRAVTSGSWQARARQRIARLTQSQLHLRTERVYRTDEQPVFELVSRNIETVRVRVFRLDLADYFRATHTAGSVDRLDIEVIAPDVTFDSPVVDYVPHRETTRQVELPFAQPGAYVVKVDDREFEATTMVLVSDLAMITKSSRHELLVFTQDTKDERAAAGVTVAVSDGEAIVAEGVTDADGVFRYRGEALQNHDRLLVFVVDGSGSGASSVELSGLGYTTGLQPKGYLFTDRPLYQPGQRVHIKGIVREVEGGVYRLPAAEGYRLQVHGPSGRLVAQRDVDYTGFGTFASDLDLPPSAELGSWRVTVDRPGEPGLAFAGQFEVRRYERPRLQLRFELDEPLVFRGEPIEGRIVAEWFYGEPAVGREVVWRMAQPDGAVIEQQGTTNAAGEVEFTLPTGEFAEEAMALLQAALPAENAAAQVAVPVVTTEFVPSLRTVRDVYLAGEPFEVEVTIEDRAGEPLQRRAAAVLLRLEQAGKGRSRGELVEVEVARQAVQTDADGTARVTMTAAEGGRYRVRVEAEDRFGNQVSAALPLLVSGEDDEVKLRLLTDREHWRVGETAPVKVVNRAGDKLALLCWQGDGVLAYEARVLPAGESVLDLELRPEHAPNFALSVAMIDGSRLHTAERALRVRRDLQVLVEVPEQARPGGVVAVKLTTTDPQGRPVRAEVALAMVDEALLALQGDAAPDIAAHFYGTLRETAFRTASSCVWSYDGPSRPVNEALLREERRRDRLEAAEPAGEAVGDEVADAEGAPANGLVDLARSMGRLADRQQQAQGGFGPAQTAAADPEATVRFLEQASGQTRHSAQDLLGGPAGFDTFSLGNLAGFYAGGRVVGLPVVASDEPRVDFRETGAWFSAIETGDDGIAEVEIELPHSTTGWRLDARAVTADTWVGQGEARLRTQQELQVELVGPPALTEGDRTQLGVRLHNLTGDELAGRAELQITAGDRDPATRGEDVELGPGGEATPQFPYTAASADGLRLELTGTAGELTDTVAANVPVQPFGVEVVAGRAGSTRGEAAFELSLPEGREYTALRMLVELGPDPGRDLVRAALGSGFIPWNCRQIAPTSLARSSRGIAALRALAYLERGGVGTRNDRDRLTAQAQAMLQQLIALQRDDGSYAWVREQHRDVRSTCQVVRFLAACRQRGMPAATEPLTKAADWLLQALRTAPNAQRPDIVWALATAGRVRFESLNSLHRVRGGLDADGLGRLALAWHEFGRPALAAEVTPPLRQALAADALDQHAQTTVALGALALLRSDPRDAVGTAAAAWLEAHRRGAGWSSPPATAAAIAVLALVRGTWAGAPQATEISVTVGGQELLTRPPQAEGLETMVAVPADWLRGQGNEVRIRVAGGGQAFYSVSLIGFAAGFSDEDRNRGAVRIDRHYLAAERRHAGRPVSAGFSVVHGRDYPTWQNEITQLRVGESGRVTTHFALRRDDLRERVTPLVVEEPIPAGCSVPRGSIQGSFDHVEVLPDRLVLYFREGVASGMVRYELQARFPGNYRALPTMVYSATDPGFRGFGPVGDLTVHARGAGDQDDYRLTPDELYHLGTARFEAASSLEGEAGARELALAHGHLTTLLDDWQKQDYQLRDDVLREVARMMLLLSIERDDSRGVVRFFEQLKDRYADLVIPFDKILAVGESYFDLGEFEAALLVFRATAETSFLKDAAVVTTLEQLGEVEASTDFLIGLLRSYPDLNTMRVARYSLGQKLAALAASRDPAAPVDPRVGSSVQLRTRALAQFREFLILYPEDPLAEEVSFAWATTCLEGDDLEAALAVASRSLQRYALSSFTDEMLYTKGYAHFALGQHEDAFAALERVATEQFPDPQGGLGDSDSKWHAVYLQGQIHHARGEPAEALAAYERVEDRFTDAGEARHYFLRKDLSLPEVTTVGSDEPVTLELTFRNVAAASLQVFRVDLMRLYLLEKSLNDIRGIQLHGIAPLLARDVELGSGRDYRERTRAVDLELDEPGAYLVVARGDGEIATGMVLISDLVIEAQEQLATGRIRVNVKRGEAFLADTHVKVVGSGSAEIRSGDTDLRGVFVADGLVGHATVIVKKDEEYAFYRGEGIHRPAQYVPEKQAAMLEQLEQLEALKNAPDARLFDALEQNLQFNEGNRSRQVEWLQREVLDKQQKGVEVFRTK